MKKPSPSRDTCGPAHGQRSQRDQRGATLIVVMLLLLVTMLMAVAGLRTANLEERMAGNTRDRQIAFQAAEAALRDAEQLIAGNTSGPFSPLRPSSFDATCPTGLCRSSLLTPLWSGFSDSEWTSSKTWAYGAATGASALPDLASQPRFVIEYQGTLQPIEPGKPCVALFLVTARAAGSGAGSTAILQSVYRHRAGECYAAV